MTFKNVLRFILSLKWVVLYVYLIALLELVTGNFSPILHKIHNWLVVVFGTILIVGFINEYLDREIPDDFED